MSSGSSFNPSDPHVGFHQPLPLSQETPTGKKPQKDAPDTLTSQRLGPTMLKTTNPSAAKEPITTEPKKVSRHLVPPTGISEKGKERVDEITHQAVQNVKEKKEGFGAKILGLFTSKAEKKGEAGPTLPKKISKMSPEEIANMPVQDLRHLKKDSLKGMTNDQLKALSHKLQGVPLAERAAYADVAKGLLTKVTDWPHNYATTIKNFLSSKQNISPQFDLWNQIGRDPRVDFNDPKWHLLSLLTMPEITDKEVSPYSSDPNNRFLIEACDTHNYEALDFLTNELKAPIPEKAVFKNFEKLLEGSTPESRLPDFIRPFMNSMGSNGETLLTTAVKGNSAPYVNLLKQSGVPLDIRNKEGKTALDIAATQQKYTLCHILEGESFFNREAENILKMPVNDLKNYLWNAFLSSDSRDVHRVIDRAINTLETRERPFPEQEAAALKELKEIKLSFQASGSLIARNPNSSSQNIVKNNHGLGEDYINQQMTYSQGRENAYQTVLNEAKSKPDMQLDAIILSLASSRKKGFQEITQNGSPNPSLPNNCNARLWNG